MDTNRDTGLRETDSNLLADRGGQPIGMPRATGIDRSDTEQLQGSENGGGSSTPEESPGSLQHDASAPNPFAVRDPQVSEANTNTTPIQDPEHTVRNTDSVSGTVIISSLGLV